VTNKVRAEARVRRTEEKLDDLRREELPLAQVEATLAVAQAVLALADALSSALPSGTTSFRVLEWCQCGVESRPTTGGTCEVCGGRTP